MAMMRTSPVLVLSLALCSCLARTAAAAEFCKAAGTCHLPLKVGDRVPPAEARVRHDVCFPEQRKLGLEDLDYRANKDGQMHVTVVGTFYAGCTPGRQDFPTYQQVFDLVQQVYFDPKVKPAFLASLKGGVNQAICEAWGTRGKSNVTTPVAVVDDSKRTLHYTFFTNVHPEYVVLDVDMRVHARFPAANFTLLEKAVRELMDKRIAEGPPADAPAVEKVTEAPAPEAPVPYQAASCVPAFGKQAKLQPLPIPPALKPQVQNPRDLDFHPQTGELWVAMNDTESLLLLDIDNPARITGVTRRDRAPYHYMAQIAAIAFDKRNGRFATCQEADNNYHHQDVANFFMGPTLYDSTEEYPQLVTADGKPCPPDRPSAELDGMADESCFYWHDDMLHAAPLCVGMVHELDAGTPHDNVYWAVAQAHDPLDPRYDGVASMLLRYDFEQPHGPGSLDHSLAAVRRYTDVTVSRMPGVVSHLAFHSPTRQLFVTDTVAGRILVVDVDSGRFEGPARNDFWGNYSIWSSPETTFEYSVYGCTSHAVFAEGLKQPAGIVLTDHHLVVAEHATGDLVALDLATGAVASRVATGVKGLQGLAVSPDGALYAAGGRNGEVYKLDVSSPCGLEESGKGMPPAFGMPERTCGPLPENATRLGFAINHIAHDCGYGNISDMCLGEQYGMSREVCYGNPDEIVKTDTGYGDLNTFNNDMLLMTGYLCHKCLPEVCMNGGTCSNIWSVGFTCACPEGFAGTLCEIDVAKRAALAAPAPTPSAATTAGPAPTTAARGGYASASSSGGAGASVSARAAFLVAAAAALAA